MSIFFTVHCDWSVLLWRHQLEATSVLCFLAFLWQHGENFAGAWSLIRIFSAHLGRNSLQLYLKLKLKLKKERLLAFSKNEGSNKYYLLDKIIFEYDYLQIHCWYLNPFISPIKAKGSALLIEMCPLYTWLKLYKV